MMPLSRLLAVTSLPPPMPATSDDCVNKAHRHAKHDDSMSVSIDDTFLYINTAVNNGTSMVHSVMLNVPDNPSVYVVISMSVPLNPNPIKRYSSSDIVMLGTVVYIM